MLHSITSGSAVFDNGSIFSAANFDSGLGTLGVYTQPWLQNRRTSSPVHSGGFSLGLGPLFLTEFIGGLGAFYTDFNTPLGIGDASGWSSAVTLSTNVHLDLPFVSLGGRVGGYYLPFEDKWGYGTPSPFLSMGIGGLGFIDPGGSFVIGTKGTLAGWDFVIYDSFTAEAMSLNLTDYFFDEPPWVQGQLSATLPQTSAADRVGRYQFGGAYLNREVGVNERFQAPRFATRGGSLLNQDSMWFTNSAGAVIGKLLTPTVRNLYWFRRDDFWATNSFTKFGNAMTGGAYIDSYGSPYIRPFAGYQFGTVDDFQSMHHILQTGSWGALTPDISYAANIGWVWTTGNQNDLSTALYEIVLAQSIGTRFQQYLGGGRTVSDPTFGERYLTDYVNYGLSYLINSKTVIQAVGGGYQNNGVLSGLGNSKMYNAGIRLRHAIGRSFLSISAINEHYDFDSTGQEIDQWVYRALYSLPFRDPRTTAYIGYQYMDRKSNLNSAAFAEHLLLFYVTQRF